MHRLFSSYGRIVIIVLALEIALIAIVSGSVQGDDEPVETRTDSSLLNSVDNSSCRYGVAALGDHQVDWVDDFGAGWYLNFSTSAVSAPNNAEFTPVISVKQDKTDQGEYLPTFSTSPPLTDNGLGVVVDSRPGALWIVGNEVDRGPDPGEIIVNQGDTYPEIYARAYHDVYHFIKNRDPLAQVANSALVQITPGRLQYLDIMWNAYSNLFGTTMPVDVWNMHIYILPEVNQEGQPNSIASVALGTDPSLGRMESYDPDGPGPLEPKDTCHLDEVYCYAEHDDMSVFAAQITAMRNWMSEHGQQNKPLILSEFSILYPFILDPGGTCFIQDEYGNCFAPDRVVNFLNNSFNYLDTISDIDVGYPQDEYRLVQQSLWFSINSSGVGYVSNLIDGQPLGPTEVGQAYQSYVDNQFATINLYGASVSYPKVFTQPPGDSATAMLSVSVRNNGNQAPLSPFEVTFYKDGSLTQPIGTKTIQPPRINNPGMIGCARKDIIVDVPWEGLTTGKHRYWVLIDNEGVIDESQEDDNVTTGFVLVNPDQVFTPLTRNR
jgi:hypothetical protein